MKRMLAAPLAVLLHLDPVRIVLLALGTGVVAPLAVCARERDDVSGHYSITLATAPPAPPPARSLLPPPPPAARPRCPPPPPRPASCGTSRSPSPPSASPAAAAPRSPPLPPPSPPRAPPAPSPPSPAP